MQFPRGIFRLSAVLAIALSGAVSAQPTGSLPSVFDEVGIDEQLGSTIPLEAVFLDESGSEVTLGRYFDGTRPVMLNLVYHDCPMLCSLLLTEFTKTLQELAWQPGEEFDVLTVSFSATEMPDLASRAKARYLEQLGNPAAATGWHFLTGSEASVAALAGAIGFRFKWIEETREYAHPAALMFLSGEGVITRYIHGMGYPPEDVRKALVEASQGQVGTTIDRIILYCYRYDAASNSYVLHAERLMKAGGALTVFVLGFLLFLLWGRERRQLVQASA